MKASCHPTSGRPGVTHRMCYPGPKKKKERENKCYSNKNNNNRKGLNKEQSNQDIFELLLLIQQEILHFRNT